MNTETQKAAQRAASKRWYERNRAKANAQTALWWKRHPEARLASAQRRIARMTPATRHREYERHRATMLKRLYGLSMEAHEERTKAQGDACAICSMPSMTRQRGRRVPLTVDHDHVTGRVRALLCKPCNTGLGAFYDDRERLLNAVAYLDEKR